MPLRAQDLAMFAEGIIDAESFYAVLKKEQSDDINFKALVTSVEEAIASMYDARSVARHYMALGPEGENNERVVV